MPVWLRLRFAPIFVALSVTACSAASGDAGAPPSAPAGGALIVADGLAFDRTRLEIPAEVAFPLLFENRDGAPHNVAILDERDDSAVFVGEIFGGPGSRTYAVPPIAAGTYRFRCDVHPDMAGTVIAAPPGTAVSGDWSRAARTAHTSHDAASGASPRTIR
jgi:plastocyanin